MSDSLLGAVGRYAEAHVGQDGVARTPVGGLTMIRAQAPGDIQYAISRPLVALVVQGSKHVSMGDREYVLHCGDTLLITADVPTVSRVVQASRDKPYLSVVFDLDPALVASLTVEMKALPAASGEPVRVEPTDDEVADAFLRLLRLVERPAPLSILREQHVRELHYWLLAGRHGPAIRQLGLPDSQAQQVAKAVAVLRAEYDRPLPVERLASVAGMSVSTFHHHFRAVTSLSPLQFQKQLRLIEARRLLLADGYSASRAAFAVGYESSSQFSREYGRMFGQPPSRDAGTAKQILYDAAHA